MDKIRPKLNKNFRYKKHRKTHLGKREISKLIKYIEISNKIDLSTTKTSFLRKLFRALPLIFRDNYAKSRHNYLLEMGYF
ncbi:hypothetical protein [Anaerococcus ihuae]|uniref:hypothetical protein n=1 Tax=Anaerococcus ihuae TaxID=2899519 RepID=UPI001F422FAE|nr:hypothetical protein [Anaerococcus ihuae]